MDPLQPTTLQNSQPGRRLRLAYGAALALLALALTWHVTVTVAQPGQRWVLPDLAVYRAAVDAAFAGHPVYAGGFTAQNLPWLYPPFALLVVAPLAWLPATAAKVATSLVSLAALACSCYASLRATTIKRDWLPPLTLASTAVLLASEPMQQNLIMGQINVVVAALVLIDVLLPTGHPRKGLWVGLAAGIKLTPALVIVYYLLRRDWTAARNAAVAFTATTILGALAFPGQSWTYWTKALLADRIGPAHLGNQSLLGAMLRLGAFAGVEEPAIRTGWLLLAVSIGLVALLILARLNPDPLGTYCSLAVITLLVSPLSWTPHWISLAAPAVIWLASRHSSPRLIVGTLLTLGLLLFAWPVDDVWSGLVWFVYPSNYWAEAPTGLRTLAWCLVGSLYAILGAATLAGILIDTARRGTVRNAESLIRELSGAVGRSL